MRRELQRINIGAFTVPAGAFRQRTDIPETARDLLAALKIGVPPQDPRVHHARELIRAPRDAPPPRDNRRWLGSLPFPKVRAQYAALGRPN